MSAAVAALAIKALGNISSGILAEANANAANMVDSANAYAANLVRSANNELGSKRASLARYTQSVNNNRVLENTGNAAEAAAVNYRRARDSEINDDFETQIRNAEQMGAQAAAAAFSGLQGGVADVVNSTTALRRARLLARSDAARKQADTDASRMQRDILLAGWDSLDNSEISDGIDYSVNVATKRVTSGNLFSQILGAVDSKDTANMLAGAGKFFKSMQTDMLAPTQDSYYGE